MSYLRPASADVPNEHGQSSSPPTQRCRRTIFLVALHRMLRVCFPTDTVYSRTRLACIEHLYLCYEELKHWVDGGISSARLSRFGKTFLILYSDLGRQAGGDRAASNCMWRTYPKFHLFAHLCSEAQSNPRDTWNYSIESEIGDATAVAARCSKIHLHRTLLRRHALASYI